MAIVRFRPFGQAVDSLRDFGDIQAEVNRLFDSFLGRPDQVAGMRAGVGSRRRTCTRPRTSW